MESDRQQSIARVLLLSAIVHYVVITIESWCSLMALFSDSAHNVQIIICHNLVDLAFRIDSHDFVCLLHIYFQLNASPSSVPNILIDINFTKRKDSVITDPSTW